MKAPNICVIRCAYLSRDSAEFLARLSGERGQYSHEPITWTEEERDKAKRDEQVLSAYPLNHHGDLVCKHCGMSY